MLSILQHRFVEVVVTGFVARLLAALALIPVGFFILTQAYPALWANEGRASFAEEAAGAPVASHENPEHWHGRFVSVSGRLHGKGAVGDPDLLAPGPWVGVFRQVETWAWNEEVTVESERRYGGAEQVTTVWNYARQAVSEVMPAAWMKHPEGHENPEQRYYSAGFFPEATHLGPYRIDPSQAVGLPPVPLDPEEVTLIGDAAGAPIVDGAVFIGKGTPEAPELGDQWVRWYVFPEAMEVTAFGEVIGETLREHPWQGGVNVLFVAPGEREEAIAMLQGIDAMLLWAIRIGGLIAIWFGLFLLLSPIFVLFDVLPPIGVVVRVVVGFALVFPALLTGVGTIVISQTLHSAPALLVLGGLGLYAIYASVRLRRDRVRFGER